MCAFSTILRMSTAYARIAFYILRSAVIVMQIGLIPLVSLMIGKVCTLALRCYLVVQFHLIYQNFFIFYFLVFYSIFGSALFKPMFCHY